MNIIERDTGTHSMFGCFKMVNAVWFGREDSRYRTSAETALVCRAPHAVGCSACWAVNDMLRPVYLGGTLDERS